MKEKLSSQEIARSFADAKRRINEGRDVEAGQILCMLLEQEPDNVDFRFHLAKAQLKGQPASALENLSQVVSLDPGLADGYALMGDAWMLVGNKEEATAAFRTALKLDDKNLGALSGLGYLLTSADLELEEAISLLERAIAIKPSYDRAQMYLAMALFGDGQEEAALKHGYKAIKLSPREDSHYINLGILQQEMGNMGEARRLLEHACNLNPALGEAYCCLSRSCKFRDTDRPLIRKMEKALDFPMSRTSRDNIHFALGKVYDDLNEWDKAFRHFEQGNRLIHPPHDDSSYKKEAKDLKSFFNASFFRRHAKTNKGGDRHIFIVGMPRCGSTLVDQILTAHPEVRSIGESPQLWNLIIKNGLGIANEKKFSFCKERFTEGTLSGLAEEYAAKITRSDDGDSVRIVNKYLENLFALGVIAIAFPEAKIIHMRRHPLDTCLSCYFQRFTYANSLSWAYDLRSVGLYYRKCQEAITHWKSVLPVQILEVNYEDLVQELEPEARRVLDFCGLEWDPAVLEFHRISRAVRTASVIQVRQPVYKSSVSRWRHYAKYIQPLVDTLGEDLIEDYPELEKHGLRVKKPFRLKMKYFGA